MPPLINLLLLVAVVTVIVDAVIASPSQAACNGGNASGRRAKTCKVAEHFEIDTANHWLVCGTTTTTKPSTIIATSKAALKAKIDCQDICGS